eukprot:179488_1
MEGPQQQEDEKRKEDIVIQGYQGERDIDSIMALVDRDLSEPYSIFTYRYFLHGWPELCFLAKAGEKTVGVVVCKADGEIGYAMEKRGYIAMLAIDTHHRRRGIGSTLATRAIQAMLNSGCSEITLETEATNTDSLKLYERLGFCREERLIRYYLNNADAFRLCLPRPIDVPRREAVAAMVA